MPSTAPLLYFHEGDTGGGITQTGNNEVENEQKDNFFQTDTSLIRDCATNTEALTYDEVLKVDSNEKIHPNEGEILLEVTVGHEAYNWEEIETMLQRKLILKMVGRPWISNNGNLCKTIGFKTFKTLRRMEN